MTAPARQSVEFKTSPRRDLAIYFDDGMPPEVRDAWDSVLPVMMDFFPRDLSELSLGWDQNDTIGHARIRRTPNYRYARIVLCPSFLSLDSRRRLQTALHEVAHMYLGAYDQAFREAIKALAPDQSDPARMLCESLQRHEEERAVEELAFAMFDAHERRSSKEPPR